MDNFCGHLPDFHSYLAACVLLLCGLCWTVVLFLQFRAWQATLALNLLTASSSSSMPANKPGTWFGQTGWQLRRVPEEDLNWLCPTHPNNSFLCGYLAVASFSIILNPALQTNLLLASYY